MADTEGWSRKVFRLRQVPGHVSGPLAATSLLSEALSIPRDHITIFSLATTLNRWEEPPSKVATLQLKSVPKYLADSSTGNGSEWSIPVPGGKPNEMFILDTHFNGMTVLNDPVLGKHLVE